jgi:hypothetical protein
MVLFFVAIAERFKWLPVQVVILLLERYYDLVARKILFENISRLTAALQ